MALLAVIIYVGIIDRVGRRWPVCIAYTILTVCLWLIGALYYAQTAASGTGLVGRSEAVIPVEDRRDTGSSSSAHSGLHLAALLLALHEELLHYCLRITLTSTQK